MSADVDRYKRRAAERAVEAIRPGMVVGLGHGSTAAFALERIAELIREGALRDIVGIPCSSRVEAEAERLGIPLSTLEEHPVVDVTIDGADEIDSALDMIKGGGGALWREKIVAQASRAEIIAADHSKLVPALGTRGPVPIEVVAFGAGPERDYLAALGAEVSVRMAEDGAPLRTDEGNLILDADFGPIGDPAALAERLQARAAIVEHGLFLGIATEAIIAGPDGVRHLRRAR